tara:strand:+ start:460 stop:750 length:291 start_codon:yes stop_codon:yes gene_type:complete
MAISAAEILQVSNSSTLLIGDQNRTYRVKIACLEVDPLKESSVVALISSRMPRHSRVNLKPKGSEDGMLVSRVISLDGGEDIGELILSKNWAKNTC